MQCTFLIKQGWSNFKTELTKLISNLCFSVFHFQHYQFLSSRLFNAKKILNFNMSSSNSINIKRKEVKDQSA